VSNELFHLFIIGAIPIDDYGQRFSNFLLFTVIASGVNCTGLEQTIQECLTSTTALSCSRNYAGVVCQGRGFQCMKIILTLILISQQLRVGVIDKMQLVFFLSIYTGNDTVPSSCTDGELRLVNGSAPNEGRVEICFNNAWGTVCSRSGISNGTVIAACRTLGFAPIGKQFITIYGLFTS